MRALLALEDGSIFPGRAFGSLDASGGEVVFNTSMSGYQEILTDPSYHGQIVVFTASHIGNYGIHRGHDESSSVRVAGVVTREACLSPSHPDSWQSLPSYLREHHCFGLTEVDTRALTLTLRRKGSLRGWLTTEVTDPADAVQNALEVPPMEKIQAVAAVTTTRTYRWPSEGNGAAGHGFTGEAGSGAGRRPADETGSTTSRPGALPAPRVAILDCGVKHNILRALSGRGCLVTVVPATTEPEEIERMAPDGIVLSNGPGDPGALREWLPRVTSLIQRYPTLAICLGHQLAALSFGCRIIKLPFGHHGGNHPVKDLRANRVVITAQNHNYAIDGSFLPPEIEVTHLNLNDGTVEGMAHRELPLWSVQYHPEAGPGPSDAASTFDQFTDTLFRHARKRALEPGWEE